MISIERMWESWESQPELPVCEELAAVRPAEHRLPPSQLGVTAHTRSAMPRDSRTSSMKIILFFREKLFNGARIIEKINNCFYNSFLFIHCWELTRNTLSLWFPLYYTRLLRLSATRGIFLPPHFTFLYICILEDPLFAAFHAINLASVSLRAPNLTPSRALFLSNPSLWRAPLSSRRPVHYESLPLRLTVRVTNCLSPPHRPRHWASRVAQPASQQSKSADGEQLLPRLLKRKTVQVSTFSRIFSTVLGSFRPSFVSSRFPFLRFAKLCISVFVL